MLVRIIRITKRLQNVNYHMPTKVRVFWLAAKLANVSCNGRALFARCPRHIQSVFNLIVDIHVMVNWQLWKRVSADQCHMSVSRAQVYYALRSLAFFKVMYRPVIGFNWSQAQLLAVLYIKSAKWPLINLVCSVITGISLQWPHSRSISCIWIHH